MFTTIGNGNPRKPQTERKKEYERIQNSTNSKIPRRIHFSLCERGQKHRKQTLKPQIQDLKRSNFKIQMPLRTT